MCPKTHITTQRHTYEAPAFPSELVLTSGVIASSFAWTSKHKYLLNARGIWGHLCTADCQCTFEKVSSDIFRRIYIVLDVIIYIYTFNYYVKYFSMIMRDETEIKVQSSHTNSCLWLLTSIWSSVKQSHMFRRDEGEFIQFPWTFIPWTLVGLYYVDVKYKRLHEALNISVTTKMTTNLVT